MISINYRDSRPIYEQVKDGFIRLIVGGMLPAGERLPSVRELAGQLAINPNTIQRAYRALEAEGYIASLAGKGSFVCERNDENREQREALLRQFDELCGKLRWLGVSTEQLCDRLKGGNTNAEH